MLRRKDGTRPPGGRSSSPGAYPDSLSIVVPVLNEAATIEACLRRLAPLRRRGVDVVVVDGGSTDGTADIAQPLCDTLAHSGRGRAVQMNAGARVASGDVLLFLHADTELPANADEIIIDALRAHPSRVWGRFDVLIDGSAPLLRLVGRMMCLRSRLTGIATGDQAIFCDQRVFSDAGAFPAIPLMEDVALSKRLRSCSPPLCLHEKVITSARRWEAHGVMATILLMWWLRFAYAIGVPPATLSRWYQSTNGSPPSDDRHTLST
ncbi:MAG: glycosyltransferase [Paraburkholderia sp.]|nr:MAG: glycosyltransferase [Paraburkholderia sp.]